jgi:uncharacterized phage protein (TIGR02218 family)
MKTLPLTLTDRVAMPARLVTIERRDGTVIRIAEAQAAITVDGNTFTPVPGCEISAVKHTLGGEVPSMQIDAVHSDGGTFDTAAIDIGLYDAASVNLYIVNRANPTTLGLLFSGTIQPVNYDISGLLSFDIRGHAVGAGTGYIQHFAPMCRTDLFSSLCGVDPDAYERTATVAGIIDRFNFTVAGLSGSPPADGWFNGGVILTADGIAFEAANWDLSSLQITAFLPCNRMIAVGMSLTMWPGCDKRLATCHGKFNNTLNFQGEPHSIGVYAAISGG